MSSFQGGEIDWSAATGAHVVYGAIDGELNASTGMTDAYGSLVRPKLGLATADEAAAYGGRVVHFQGGDIDWSAALGAHAVYGSIMGELNATATTTDATGRSVKDVLGLPTSEELATAGGRVVLFQGGEIDWSAATGAHVVYGAIRGSWTGYSGDFGLLGFPTVDEHGRGHLRVSGSRRSRTATILYFSLRTGIRLAFSPPAR